MNAPRLNEPAPQFKNAVSTKGPISLEDYKGRWLVFFSYVADFTAVCESEIIAFAQRAKDFKQREVYLLALSGDSIHAHVAWLGGMPGDGPRIAFPIITDFDGAISRSYGVISEGESASISRCLFVIDPKQVIRAMMRYPVSLGRSVDEVIRIVDALQLNTERNVYTLANWKAGEKGVAPPRVTFE